MRQKNGRKPKLNQQRRAEGAADQTLGQKCGRGTFRTEKWTNILVSGPTCWFIFWSGRPSAPIFGPNFGFSRQLFGPWRPPPPFVRPILVSAFFYRMKPNMDQHVGFRTQMLVHCFCPGRSPPQMSGVSRALAERKATWTNILVFEPKFWFKKVAAHKFGPRPPPPPG